MEAAPYLSPLPPPPRPDSMRLLADWDAWMVARGLAERTRELHGYAMLRLMRRNLGRHILDLGEPEITAFLASLGARAHSKALLWRGLFEFYGWAVSRGLIERSPVAAREPKKPPDPPPEAFTRDELTRLLLAAVWRDPRRAWAILACYSLGLRRSELVRIRIGDIGWDRGRVWLRRTKGDRPRFIEIGPLAEEALRELVKLAETPAPRGELCERCHRRPVRSAGRCGACYQFWHKYGWERPAERFADEPARDPTPEPAHDGRILPIEPNTFSEWVHEAAEDAGFTGRKMHAHTLRASFATQLLGQGVPVSVVSGLLGHAQLGTTARYLAVTNEDRHRAVKAL